MNNAALDLDGDLILAVHRMKMRNYNPQKSR